jgi:fluoride exporter
VNLAVLAGGALGTLARAGVAEALPVHAGTFPLATLVVNIAGTVLLGWLTAATDAARTLWGSGFCGALTTFSTLQVEVLTLADDGEPLLAATYLAVSVVAGLAAAALGQRLAR